MRITDEMLMAYVDDELGGADRVAIERAAREDPGVAARIEAQRRVREQIARVFADVVNQRPPDRLLKVIAGERQAARVVNLAEARSTRARKPSTPGSRQPWSRWAAIAACAVLAVGVGMSFIPTVSGPLLDGSTGSLMARGALAKALDNQLASAGVNAGELVRVGLSFRSTQNLDCRTFTVRKGDRLEGVACRDPKGWSIRMMLADPSSQARATTYRTAASELPAPVLSAVEGLIVGAPFDAQREADGRARGWKTEPSDQGR